MAMEPCPECRSLMSDRAPTCLNCGYPIASAGGQRTRDGIPAASHGGGLRGWPGLALYGTFASVLMLVAVTLWQL